MVAWLVMLVTTGVTFFPLVVFTSVWIDTGETAPFVPLAWSLIPAGVLGIASVVLAHRSLWVGQPGPGTVALLILAVVGALAAGIAFQGWTNVG